jgi:uncharacterized protein YbjT (DUF2867 family)
MANTLRWTEVIKTDGRVATPAADGKTAPIAEQDIAEIAALSLLLPGHEGKTYELTGSSLISARDQIGILSRVLGVSIACVDLEIGSALDRMRALGREDWLLESLREIWTAVRDGQGIQQTHTFEALTRRRPLGFEAWCEQHRADFS